MTKRDWKKRPFEEGWHPPLQPEWRNVKTGEILNLYFSPKEFFWSKKHPVGKYSAFVYPKDRHTRLILKPDLTTKKVALKNAIKYMVKH
jgi:hypothetical protein